MRTIYRLLIGAVIATAGCSTDSNRVTGPVPPPPDEAIEGSWGLDPAVVDPGSEFLMSLRDSAGVVSGTGTFAGEAGPFGGLRVSGVVQNDSVHLLVVYVLDPSFGTFPGDTGRLAGLLTARDTLDATITQGGFTRAVRLTRLQIANPSRMSQLAPTLY
jgi:CBS domain-containing protein